MHRQLLLERYTPWIFIEGWVQPLPPLVDFHRILLTRTIINIVLSALKVGRKPAHGQVDLREPVSFSLLRRLRGYVLDRRATEPYADT